MITRDGCAADLGQRLELIEGWVAAHPPAGQELAAWDRLADELGARANARVTLMAADGRVLGDSEVSLADLPGVENHRDREEVRDALATGSGSSVRFSATVSRPMLYMARRSSIAGGAILVVRAALPLTEVEHAVARLRWLLLGGSLLALGVAVLLSILTNRMIGRSLQSIAGAARQIAQGNLDVRIRPETTDEIGQLAATLDQLADNLSNTLRALRDERDRLERILEAMEEGVLVVDMDRMILMANPAARVLLLSDAHSSTDVKARRMFAATRLHGRSLLEAVRSADLDAIVERDSSETPTRLRRGRSRSTAATEAAGARRPAGGPEPGGAGGAGGCHRDPAPRGRPQGLRGQCVARAAHAAHGRAHRRRNRARHPRS